jgi:hypothetical protein
MKAKTTRIVLLGGLAVLISGCATEPAPPSLPPGQYLIIVKGEQGPLTTFHTLIEKERESNKLSGCVRKVPSSPGESRAIVDGQLVYECTGQTQEKRGEVLGVFARAYGNSIASLLEMKVTTSGSCALQSCGGITARYWKVPCFVAC